MIFNAYCALTRSPLLLSRSVNNIFPKHTPLQFRTTPSSSSFPFSNRFPLPFPQLRIRHSRLSTLPHNDPGGSGGFGGDSGSGGWDPGDNGSDDGGGKWSFLSWWKTCMCGFDWGFTTGEFGDMVGQAALKAASSEVAKHEKACSDNQHAFIPFAFDTFGFLAPEAVDLLHRVQKVMHSNVMSPRSMDVVFTRIGFAIQKGLAAQLVARLPSTHIISKKKEPMNTLASSVLLIFGFCSIVVGGEAILGAPFLLLWFTIAFQAFEEIFNGIFFMSMAFIVFAALSCIIQIIILASAYALKIGEGATEDDIRSLPMFRFSQPNVMVMVDDNSQSHISELSFHPDDSECCICLCSYVDGTELYRLPCTHHFHCECISRWLRTKATCPLCKFDIRRGNILV